MNIKRYFLSKPGESFPAPVCVVPPGVHSNLANKSVFNPPKNYHRHIEVFKNIVCSDLETMKIKKLRDPYYLKAGIATLEKNKNVIVRPADKGGGLVVMSKAFYKEKMDRLLVDWSTYQVLTHPVFKHKNELQALVQQGKINGVLNKK